MRNMNSNRIEILHLILVIHESCPKWLTRFDNQTNEDEYDRKSDEHKDKKEESANTEESLTISR